MRLSLFVIPLLFLPTFSSGQNVKKATKAVAGQPGEGQVPYDDVRPTPVPEPEPLDVVATSEQLAAVEDLFAGGGTVPVTFDSQRARDRGTDGSIIQLAEELAAYTNDLMTAADNYVNRRTAKSPLDVAPTSEAYPMVRRFFDAASAFHGRGGAVLQHAGRMSAEAVHAEGWCSWLITDAACTCGHWLYPQPNRAAEWKVYNSSNPAATLRSWGYHETSWLVGGGWTRPQTYYPSRCGYNTYRDHALIRPDGKSLKEQNYAGFTPRGEPNPEFWNSGTWPYPAWPTYVYWWHSNY